MPSLTRTSTTGRQFIVQTAGSLGNGPIIWTDEWGNSLGGNNSVTFDPYKVVGFKRLIREGGCATSNLVGVHYGFSNGGDFEFLWRGGTYFHLENEWVRAYTGVRGSPLVYASMPSNTSSSLSRANNAAMSKFAQRCYQAAHQLQSGVVVGELAKTISMVRNPARGLYGGVGRYLNDVMKQRLGNKYASKPQKVLDIVSNMWLEYSYGWRPLISDVKNGAKALSSVMTYRPPRVRVSASATDSSNDPGSGPRTSNEGAGRVVSYRRHQSSESSVRYSGSIQLKVDGTGAALQAAGLDLPSFLPTLWELIPYSFLADYFTNIGDIVYSFANPISLLSWCEKGTMIRSTCEVDVTGCTCPPNGQHAFEVVQKKTASGGISVKQVTRAPYNGTLIPSFQFQLPGFGLKWLNMAALAVTHSSAVRSLRP